MSRDDLIIQRLFWAVEDVTASVSDVANFNMGDEVGLERHEAAELVGFWGNRGAGDRGGTAANVVAEGELHADEVSHSGPDLVGFDGNWAAIGEEGNFTTEEGGVDTYRGVLDFWQFYGDSAATGQWMETVDRNLREFYHHGPVLFHDDDVGMRIQANMTDNSYAWQYYQLAWAPFEVESLDLDLPFPDAFR